MQGCRNESHALSLMYKTWSNKGNRRRTRQGIKAGDLNRSIASGEPSAISAASAMRRQEASLNPRRRQNVIAHLYISRAGRGCCIN